LSNGKIDEKDGDLVIEADHLSVRDAWAEIPTLLAALPLSFDARKILGERLFARLNNLDEFVTTRTEISAALDAKRMRVILEPSPRLLRIIAALRAKEMKFLAIEHELDPTIYACASLPVRR
jgi:hypothetical protein